jgi:uncharacterized protein DUF5420
VSTVTKRYFIAEGPRAEKTVEEGVALIKACMVMRRAVIESNGAVNLYGRNGCAPYALVFDHQHADRKPGFCEPEKRIEEGETFYIHKPNKASNIGKDLAATLANVKPFSFSEFACKAFGVSHHTVGSCAGSRTGQAMYLSVAGYYAPHLVFGIPFGGEGNQGKEVEIPADLREIKKSEFIAITEESGS